MSLKPIRRAAVVVALLLVESQHARAGAQATVVPPPGAPLLLELSAEGVQIYTCTAKGNAFEWTFKAPEAKLLDKQGHEAGTHGAGPTWKSTDGSSVVGEVIGKADAPDPSAIPWLLLKAKSHEGSGALSGVVYIRRADTKGGIPPTTGCDATHGSAEARVPYSARYQFFGASK